MKLTKSYDSRGQKVKIIAMDSQYYGCTGQVIHTNLLMHEGKIQLIFMIKYDSSPNSGQFLRSDLQFIDEDK